MADIALSVGVRQSLSAIKSTAASQQKQQLMLATGKRVNSAIDNPVNFFQSSGLSNRARDLGSLLDSIGTTIGNPLEHSIGCCCQCHTVTAKSLQLKPVHSVALAASIQALGSICRTDGNRPTSPTCRSDQTLHWR